MIINNHEGQLGHNESEKTTNLELSGFAGDIGFTLKRSLQEKFIIIKKENYFYFMNHIDRIY